MSFGSSHPRVQATTALAEERPEAVTDGDAMSAWADPVRRLLTGAPLALLGLAVSLAAGVSLSFGWTISAWTTGQVVNVAAFSLAFAVAWLITRRFARLTSASVVAAWTLLAAGAVVMAAFFVTRSYYSISFLGTSFAIGALWLTATRHLETKVIPPVLAVVPGGHAHILDGLPGVRLVHLRRPAVRWLRIDGLVADLHVRHADEWARFVVEQRLGGRPVYHCADVYERFAQKISIEHLREGELDDISPPLYGSAKRVVDLLFATVGLVATAPLLAVAAILIKVEDGGPIFFTQERVGWQGRIFRMFKLRSMKVDAERHGPRMASTDDERTTKIGVWLRRFRIDELPQLLNVLRGDMSMVGPRPEQVSFVRQFEEELPFYGSRHVVKPGITGWAQVRAGYASDLPETQQKLVHDLYYVRHMSLGLDAYIVGRTVWIVMTGFGAR